METNYKFKSEHVQSQIIKNSFYYKEWFFNKRELIATFFCFNI